MFLPFCYNRELRNKWNENGRIWEQHYRKKRASIPSITSQGTFKNINSDFLSSLGVCVSNKTQAFLGLAYTGKIHYVNWLTFNA